jgi:hypothetical protein
MNIWFRREGGKPEKIDNCSVSEVDYVIGEYRMAFAMMPGQHRFGKDKLWAGKKSDEPKGDGL